MIMLNQFSFEMMHDDFCDYRTLRSFERSFSVLMNDAWIWGKRKEQACMKSINELKQKEESIFLENFSFSLSYRFFTKRSIKLFMSF